MRTTHDVVEALYTAFLAGDAAGMLALLHEDAHVRFLGQADLHGRAAAERYFEFAGGLLQEVDFTIRAIVVDGDTAAVIWSETARTAGGADWRNHGVDVIRVQGGEIVSMHENNDVRLVHQHFPRYEESGA